MALLFNDCTTVPNKDAGQKQNCGRFAKASFAKLRQLFGVEVKVQQIKAVFRRGIAHQSDPSSRPSSNDYITITISSHEASLESISCNNSNITLLETASSHLVDKALHLDVISSHIDTEAVADSPKAALVKPPFSLSPLLCPASSPANLVHQSTLFEVASPDTSNDASNPTLTPCTESTRLSETQFSARFVSRATRSGNLESRRSNTPQVLKKSPSVPHDIDASPAHHGCHSEGGYSSDSSCSIINLRNSERLDYIIPLSDSESTLCDDKEPHWQPSWRYPYTTTTQGSNGDYMDSIDEKQNAVAHGVYQLINIEAGLTMDLCGNDKAPILAMPGYGGINQRWELIPREGGYFIRSIMTGRYVAIREKAKHGMNLITSTQPTTWEIKFIPGCNAYRFSLSATGSSPLCLAVKRTNWLRDQIRDRFSSCPYQESTQLLSASTNPCQDWRLIPCSSVKNT